MKNIVYSYPKSSFLSMEKDLNLIVSALMKNDSLKRMLYYSTKDCMLRPKLTEDQTLELFEKNIKIVPKFEIDGTVMNYIAISFDNFLPNGTNPEFRDNIIEFDILCHCSQWQMNDFQLRPYKIAAELDTMFNNKHLTGIGTLEFLGATKTWANDDYAGLCVLYRAVHGEEDKTNMLKASDQEQFVENYNQMFN